LIVKSFKDESFSAAIVSGRSKNFEYRGGGRRQCISPVVIYRKHTHETMPFIREKAAACWKKIF